MEVPCLLVVSFTRAFEKLKLYAYENLHSNSIAVPISRIGYYQLRKKVITRYERSGRHEYKFINDSSKDVFVIYTSNSNGMVREDGFMIVKGAFLTLFICLWVVMIVLFSLVRLFL